MHTLDDIARTLQGYDPQALRMADATTFIDRLVAPVQGTEVLPLRQCLGRVLAEDLISSMAVPAHDNSAMDGFAFNGAMLAGQSTLTLRIAGTAELNGYDRDLNPVRCQAIVRRVEALFPGAGDSSRAEFWTGLRPTTPSNLPVIGKSKLPNLFLNTGHGTLGWTHACGSGKSIARIVSGLAPELDFQFAGVDRPARVGAGALRPA